ncbi:MAG: plasma-membrane proton-efflux P-type ATPase [Anaerolineae bacterium]|nr:plasma-membrane proton-efflux P-type ATPase [Anaerolineae bacterium]
MSENQLLSNTPEVGKVSTVTLRGLTSQEAAERLRTYGPNQISEEKRRSPLRRFLAKFGGVIPFILEITMLLQFALGKIAGAVIILVMLVVNAVISFFYENKAYNSLAALQQQLRINARVLRDDTWQLLPARELVPGDIIRLRAGDIVPADAHVISGHIAVDQSAMTGESHLVEIGLNERAHATSQVRRGEAVVEIDATGMHTAYSKTAKLVQSAKSKDHGDAFVHRIVVYLMGFTLALVAVVGVNAAIVGLPFADTLLFVLALLIAAIPVSLPVTFTLGTAIGARMLAERGVLTTRLATIKEAAGMDVLCSDKTGTITRNELAVVATHEYNGFSKSKLLRLAALASDEATHDPIDLAIRDAAEGSKPHFNNAQRLEFTPFDPATKRTEAMIHKSEKAKKQTYVVKGSPHVINDMVPQADGLYQMAEGFAANGDRLVAVASAKEGKPLKVAGLVALQDPPREDAASVIQRLQALGVRVVMITGDGLATAQSIAQQVGITGAAITSGDFKGNYEGIATEYDVIARVYPEDKFKLVQALQHAGHVVGMTGDGINDAPAIRQAEVGVAVDNATDIAKSAAGLVLTTPGLAGLLAAVEVGRSVFQRIFTYTLNKITKTFHLGLFLSFGLILTGELIVQPLHILLLVLVNDLVSMSLTTDNVRPSRYPDRWRAAPLFAIGLIMALGWLVFSFSVYGFGRDILRLDAAQMETLMFLMLVCVAQANVYLVRERQHFWKSRPSKWLLLASAVGIVLTMALVLGGVLMTALDSTIMMQMFWITIAFMAALDYVKVGTFKLFKM